MSYTIKLTIRSGCSQLLSVVLLYLSMPRIPCALRRGAYRCGGNKSIFRGAFSDFSPFIPLAPLQPLYFPLFIIVTGACLLGVSWLGCQVLPAIGAISFLGLAANSGISRMCQAPNLHLATPLLSNVTF